MRYAAVIVLGVLAIGTVSSTGEVVRNRYHLGDEPTMRPGLNSAVALSRTLSPDEAAIPGAAMGLGVYAENTHGGVRSLWPVYAEANTNGDAGGAAVSLYGRMRNSGSGWGSAVHAEPIHSGTGVTNGVNVEMSPMVATGRTVGVNVQAMNGYGEVGEPGIDTQRGINLRTEAGVRFTSGIAFENAACGTGVDFQPGSSSDRAIWIRGTHAMGIESNAPIRVQSGVPLELSSNGAIEIVFANGRIEFRNGARLLGWLAIDATATGGRIN